MNKKYLILGSIGVFICLMIVGVFTIIAGLNKEISTIKGMVIDINEDIIMLQSDNDSIYTFKRKNIDNIEVGDNIGITFKGLLDEINTYQDGKVVSYEVFNETKLSNEIPSEWLDDGIFSKYYLLAYDKLKTMSIDEKIGQLILAHYSSVYEDEAINDYKVSGFVFYENDFRDKDENEVKEMMDGLQSKSKIPLLSVVDCEGGDVVRLSRNSKLRDEVFKSPSELYNTGGFDLIRSDTIEKSKFLKNLGINVNLAPVVDIVSEDKAYLYDRTIKLDTEGTSKYAETVIKASKNLGVSYAMKHFPGYGNADDSHTEVTYVNESLDELYTSYLPPFKTGIDSGASSILVNHNIYTSIDKNNPATLSPTIHNILTNYLDFSGVIITDELSMEALSGIDNMFIKAIKAGNHLIITLNHEKAFSEIKGALNNGEISEYQINKLAFKIIAWKYYMGIMFNNLK